MPKENAGGTVKPRVVFDPKMPRYEYRDSGGHSLSVDRKNTNLKKPRSNMLSSLKVS